MKLTELNKSMNDDQRFALHFGPYHAPPFHYGDVVMDEVRGEVTVIQLSDAKIPWPIGKLRQGRSLIVYGGLADAIRRESNQAVCHWWGITPQTVSKWRKVLKVEPLNVGSRELFVRYGREERSLDALPNARAAASLPEARRKLVAASHGPTRSLRFFGGPISAARRQTSSDENGARPNGRGPPVHKDQAGIGLSTMINFAEPSRRARLPH